MSSIKPPDGRSNPVPQTGTASSEPTAPERASGSSFREALEQAGAAGQALGAAAPGAASAANTADPVSALAQAVRSGALSPEQAIDRLVERAVSGVGARLSPAQRAELTTVLRASLESDPALRELRDAVK